MAAVGLSDCIGVPFASGAIMTGCRAGTRPSRRKRGAGPTALPGLSRTIRRKDRPMNEARVTREGIRIHAAEDFAGMHAAGQLTARILDEVGSRVQPGATTAEIDDFIRRRVEELGATSATIGYRGYQHA